MLYHTRSKTWNLCCCLFPSGFAFALASWQGDGIGLHALPYEKMQGINSKFLTECGIENFEKLKDLISKDSLFWFCALSGSGMFVIQFLLTLVGAIDHEELDDHAAIDAGRVNWFSKQAITGFLMMFGWSALTCQYEFGLQGPSTVAIACAVGLIAVFITGFIFKTARKLCSSGTVFRLDDAIGKEATVYQRIPKGGIGKISVSLHHLTHEIDAISLDEEEISSFISVRIIKKMDNNTVVVVPIQG